MKGFNFLKRINSWVVYFILTAIVFGIAIFTFLLFLCGFILGHIIKIDNSENWGTFQLTHYFHSFFVIVVPNILFCTVIVCITAWFSKNKMLVYLSGLGIYILYMVFSIFSNTPLVSGASPVSDAAMSLSAKLDPFGLAAFFEQTKHCFPVPRYSS